MYLKLIIYSFFVGLLISCSPQTRFNRLIKKHPELLTTDTMVIHDTIRDTIIVEIPEVRTDTVLHVDSIYDTVYLEKDRLKIKIVRKLDSIYVDGRCDTIYIERPYEKIIERKIPIKYYEKRRWYDKYKYLILIFLLTLLIIYISKKTK
jgi:hypothetical protein